jgi:hypothetical protein
MKSITPWLAGLAICAAASAGYLAAQDRLRARAHDGPYRVFISKPIVGLGYTAGDLYREHEYLGAMLNQLDAAGMVPILTEVLTQTLEGREDEDRLLVVCRAR